MKLELLSTGNMGAGRKKAALISASKKLWRGKYDRRKRPRDEDALVEFTPKSSSNEQT